jgi:hypothetical protein
MGVMTQPDAPHKQLLHIKPNPIGKRKTIINWKKSVAPTDPS